MIRTAAIMARGLGTRMRRTESANPVGAGTVVNAHQTTVADTGIKGMIPLGGDLASGRAPRPFLDFVLSSLADVGVDNVVLVLAPPPEHDSVRDYFSRVAPPTRLRIRYAIQQQPLGTANAVTAAADVIGSEPFLVLNADNYYPVEALRALVAANSAATVAFDRDALVRDGNIDRERVGSFAVLTIADDGLLAGIIEKPGDSLDLASDAARWVGMNCWVVTPAIVEACKTVSRSARGEYELPEAVAMAIRDGVEIRAERIAAPVLDLSQRADIAVVAARLAPLDPRP